MPDIVTWKLTILNRNTPERRSIYLITDAEENSQSISFDRKRNLIRGEVEEAVKRLKMTETGDPNSDETHKMVKWKPKVLINK